MRERLLGFFPLRHMAFDHKSYEIDSDRHPEKGTHEAGGKWLASCVCMIELLHRLSCSNDQKAAGGSPHTPYGVPAVPAIASMKQMDSYGESCRPLRQMGEKLGARRRKGLPPEGRSPEKEMKSLRLCHITLRLRSQPTKPAPRVPSRIAPGAGTGVLGVFTKDSLPPLSNAWTWRPIRSSPDASSLRTSA